MQDWIGKTQTESDVITADKLARYHATLGTSGDAVPSGLHLTLCLPDAPMAALGIDGHPQKGGFLPPIDLPRRMWVGSDIQFLAPLVVGAPLQRHSHIDDITEKTGKQGALAFVSVVHRYEQNGAPCLHETQTIVYREAAAGQMALPPVDTSVAPLDGAVHHACFTPDERLLMRYSALTFNAHRIHYDLPYARDVEGYPALVVHGPLMASLVLAEADRHFAPVTRFSFRAEAPAFCGQPLYADFTRTDDGTAFLLRGGDGRRVMSGLVG